jgi:hypothetical protein
VAGQLHGEVAGESVGALDEDDADAIAGDAIEHGGETGRAHQRTTAFEESSRDSGHVVWTDDAHRGDGPAGLAGYRLLAEALLAPLAEAPGAPLRLVNIAGGPALDSIIALIMLARAHATLMQRPIAIHVFDAQQDGPAFGARALLALTAPAGPLHGLEVQFQHHAYDWNDAAPLVRLLASLAGHGALIAASSEGGLFEYGTDGAIVANLTALAQAGVPIVAGSVTSSSEVRKRMIAQTRFRLFARGLEGFAPLAERSGYTIAESHSTVMSEQVLLRPRAMVGHTA